MKASLMARLFLAGIIGFIIPGAAMAACEPLTLPPAGSKRSDIVAAVMPAVVQVQARFGPDINESYADALGDAMRETQASTNQSLGSGFMISGDGLVVTNEHVVGQATEITVRLADGSIRGATLVGSDERTDVALLRMEVLARCYPSLSWGDSDRVSAGEDIMAVGSPFGLGGSVSAGIISGRGRTLGDGPFDDFLQIDAAINQGNSGGPLLNAEGRVIGINTAILAPAGGNIGIGFSLPSAIAQRVIAELLEGGKVRRAQLGLGVQALTGDSADALGLPSSDGVLVIDIEPGSPADRAGIVPADVVLAINGRQVRGMGDLSAQAALLDAGETAQFLLWRRAAPLRVDVFAALKPDAALRAQELADKAAPGSFVSLSGLQLAGTTGSMNEVAGQNEAVSGLIVVAVAPNSPGAARGIAVGDIIIGLAGRPLSSTVQFTDEVAAARARGRQNILITLLHGRNRAWLALPVNAND
jgi:serine protease Do